MNRRNRYRRGKVSQGLVVLVLGVVLIMSLFKIQHIRGKMKYVNEGLEYYRQKEWIEAEESLQRAAEYRWFHYKEQEMNEALSSLSWITDYKEEIAHLYQKVTQSSQDKSLDTFAKDVSDYNASGFHSLTDAQREYFLERYPIEQVIFNTWTEFKVSVVNKLTDPLNNDYNWAKEKIFLIPQEYFAKDKKEAILELFRRCDQTLYDTYAVDIGIEPFKVLIHTLNDIYMQNSGYGFYTEWLTSQVKWFMYQAMLQKSKEDIDVFRQYIEVYRIDADKDYKDKTIEDIVEVFIVDQEKEAERLLRNKAYDELINFYKTLDYFKDYTKEIEAVEKMQKYDYPQMLLEKPIEQYAFALTGAGVFQANKYLVSIEKDSTKLEVFLFIGEAQSYEISHYEINLNDLGIEVGQIQTLDSEDHLIGIRLVGANRAVRYVVIRLIDNRLEYLTEFEGDVVELIDGLKHLKVTNPTSEAIVYTYDYLLGDDGYEKQEIVATTIMLSDSNLLQYVGKMVEFSCYIPEGISEGIANAYYYSDANYYSDSIAYVYREDDIGIEQGVYSITGEIVSMEPYYSMTLGLEILRPKIKIIEIQKE